MTISETEQTILSGPFSFEPSESINLKIMLGAKLAGQCVDLGAAYTPLPDGKAIWKFDWAWDLKEKTLDDITKIMFPGRFTLPKGIGNRQPGNIHAEYFSTNEFRGFRFGIGDLDFVYIKGSEKVSCWGIIREKPIDISLSGLLASIIGSHLTMKDLFIGNISGRFDQSLRSKAMGQLNQSRLLFGKGESTPTGFVGGITIMGIPLVLPFSTDDETEEVNPSPAPQDGKAAEKSDRKESDFAQKNSEDLKIEPASGNNPGAMRKWFSVDKTIGPLHLGRVGCEWKDSKIGLLLDSDIEIGGLHLGLSGLCLRIPPFEMKPEKLELDLDGIDVSYRGGPISIGGSLLKSTISFEGKAITQYDGMVMIKAADMTITGMGSYANVNSKPSLFVFAILHKTLGGPIFFRINGLSAGFGCNRTLKLPPIEEVHNFPLVRASLDEDYFKGKSIQDAMFMLREYIQPSPGDYWFAVGIRFSSFEMILSFAMLSVSFGHEVEIALLGMAKMTIPNNAPPGMAIVYAELALRAVIRPEEGTVMVEGRLTSESYIFSRNCHLTGGFALCFWLSGTHAGDFVVTLGGYHPRFVRPPHYPEVPRLGINWQVTNELTITSGLYYALTSSCIMAGGKLSAVYQSGAIKAWFIAYVDFLLNWKPLYYTADMGINIGVEAHIRIPLGLFTVSFSIAVHLNVELHIWGPEFAGCIDVDLNVITVQIRFGPQKNLPNPLNAKEFVDSFLPKQEVITTRINSGLTREEKLDKETLHVVNSHELVITTQSVIPITCFTKLKPSIPPAQLDEPGIRPMGKTRLESNYSVTMTNITNDRKNLRFSPVTANVPESLWGKSDGEGKVSLPSAPEAKFLLACVGMRISFAPIDPTGTLTKIAIEKFKYDDFQKPIPWDHTIELPSFLSAEEQKIEFDNVMAPATVKLRNNVLAILAMQNCPFYLNNVNLEKLSKSGDSCFQEKIQYRRLGEACI